MNKLAIYVNYVSTNLLVASKIQLVSARNISSDDFSTDFSLFCAFACSLSIFSDNFH